MLADTVPYTGSTAEHRRVVVEVRDHRVVRVRAGLAHYRCATFGDVGPLVVDRTGAARIGASGRFAFFAGDDPPLRLVVHARVGAHGAVRGTLRVRGTIATGQRCASNVLRFVALKR